MKPIDPGKLVVKRCKSGLGLFAKVSIPKDTYVIEYTGELLSVEHANKRGGRYLFSLNGHWTIDGRDRNNLGRYINHSCKPNCIAKITRNRILIFSVKNINKGDELNYDYGKEYFDEFIKPIGCKCTHCIRKRNGCR